MTQTVTVTPESQAELAREVEARRQRDAVQSVTRNLPTMIYRLRESMTDATIMTPEQEAEYNWHNLTVPQLRSRGLDPQHIKRIPADFGCEKQARVFARVESLCTGRGAVIALAGDRGLGKTQIAAELMKRRVEALFAFHNTLPDERQGMTPPQGEGHYAKMSTLGAQFKSLYADFGSVNAESLMARLKDWCKTPLLVLDEIHEAEDLRTQQRLLVDLVDRRYAAQNDTILISNHAPEAFTKEVNPSIVSRASEFGGIIRCDWPSWRTKKV